jgi:hypothetical protein
MLLKNFQPSQPTSPKPNKNLNKGKNRNLGQGGNPPQQNPQDGETSANPTKTLKGEIIMANHDKGEIKTFEPITLVHYVENMAITLTIPPKIDN